MHMQMLVEYGPTPGELARGGKIKAAAMAKMRADLLKQMHAAKAVEKPAKAEREVFMTAHGPAYQVDRRISFGGKSGKIGEHLRWTHVTLPHVSIKVVG